MRRSYADKADVRVKPTCTTSHPSAIGRTGPAWALSQWSRGGGRGVGVWQRQWQRDGVMEHRPQETGLPLREHPAGRPALRHGRGRRRGTWVVTCSKRPLQPAAVELQPLRPPTCRPSAWRRCPAGSTVPLLGSWVACLLPSGSSLTRLWAETQRRHAPMRSATRAFGGTGRQAGQRMAQGSWCCR